MVVVKWSVSLPRQSEFETPSSLQCFCRICVWKDRKYTKRCQVGPFKKDVNYIGSRIWVTQWVNKKYLVTLWTTKPSHQTCDIMLVQLRKLVQQAIINTHTSDIASLMWKNSHFTNINECHERLNAVWPVANLIKHLRS